MASYKVNRPSKDPTRQNKSPKRIESSRPSNRRKKPDRGSNHNTHLKEDEKTSKDELESFTYVIRNFDLDDNKSSCSISSLNF